MHGGIGSNIQEYNAVYTEVLEVLYSNAMLQTWKYLEHYCVFGGIVTTIQEHEAVYMDVLEVIYRNTISILGGIGINIQEYKAVYMEVLQVLCRNTKQLSFIRRYWRYHSNCWGIIWVLYHHCQHPQLPCCVHICL